MEIKKILVIFGVNNYLLFFLYFLQKKNIKNAVITV